MIIDISKKTIKNETSTMRHILVVMIILFGFFQVYPSIAATSVPQNFSRTFQKTTSIEQYGITWTFAEPVEYGQFVNGDYWVVDPGGGIKIINIIPGHKIHTDGIRHLNGSMINPTKGKQGFDSHIFFTGTNDYNANLNVGIGISSETPLVLTGNNSLVSTISNLIPEKSHVSYVKTAAVLTCLFSMPPSGSFRPSIYPTTKTLHNVSSINYGLLKTLAYPSTKPNITTYAGYFKVVWLDHIAGWTGRYLHPTDGFPDNYYYSWYMSDASLMLHLDYTQEQKKDLLVGFLQLGIDLYGYLETGAVGWAPDGGHSSGRKWPILFTGIMLNYAPMKNIGAISGDYLYSNSYGAGNPPPDYKHFGEDGQTFYVSQSDVNITNSALWDPDTRTAPNYPYTAEMIGMPEWGIRYSTFPSKSDASWQANYRTIPTCPSSWAGTVMAARIMGAKTLWNHDAFFDYMDRYMAISKGIPDPFGYQVPGEKAGDRPGGFRGTMWDTYRSSY